MNTTPYVSVAIPVYNGENFVAEAIESVLGQTWSDLELVICDNGSTDRTEDICKTFAARDSRVRYYRNDTNIGIVKNFNRALALASPSSKYFKFAPHDDYYDPTFLEQCVAALDEDPTAVLCNARISIVNERRDVVKRNDVELKADMLEPHERFLALLNNSKCFDLFAVIRRSALAKMPAPLLPSYGNSDGVLLARLGLLGRFQYLDEYLYYNRDYKERSGNKYKSYREFTYFIDPAMKGRIIFPRWRMLLEFFRSIYLVPLDSYQRFCCFCHLARWIGWYWKSLAANILIGAYEIGRYPIDKLASRMKIHMFRTDHQLTH